MRLAHNARMDQDLTPARSYPLAVIMERTALTSRWASEKWEAKGVVQDASAPGSTPRRIVEREGLTQVLFPGHRLDLRRDEAEGYWLNISSPTPKVFVLWRLIDDLAQPQMLTVSYAEGARWMDSGEQVDSVSVPHDLLPWMVAFVEAHYKPEPRKPRRYASNKDKGRMGHFEG